MVKLFSTDIDGTLIGKPDALERFNASWVACPESRRPLLCYNTGRLLDDMLELIENGDLMEPDYLICGVGTLIYDYRKQEKIKDFTEILEEGWNRDTAAAAVGSFSEVSVQPKHFQGPYKSSWFLRDASEDRLHEIEEALEKSGLDVNIIYSSNRDLDVVPKYANKGNALTWLIKRLNIKPSEVVVAGDTGNDSAMFRKKSIRGIVVGNAQPELHERTVGLDVYRADGVCADGVLEGLIHFGAIDSVCEPQQDTCDLPRDPSLHKDTLRLISEEKVADISDADREYLKLAYKKAVEGLRRNITPMGFSACSLEDNVTEGTDENYRSVWGRDGSITVIGSLKIGDAEMRECQRNTLKTLLDHLSLTGQVPSNVSIDTGDPDYSGVGGICSIDSGIWLIIAVFEFVRATGDLDFLRDNAKNLQRAMDWLSAQDSNNDGLIEVPEAGDWTDLFGRSYNPLYDEVLWYRANICYGRLMEMLGKWAMAGDYLRWASHIKRTILKKFWPSTNGHKDGEYSFADQQLTMGDTHYLLAQTTPFSFDWRCDVYANVMAFLFDVLSTDQAQKAFRFMWGVGVNDPYPVRNLYPVVQAGDPDWKPYYTVNLLNLPNHYHNGGIWPFVGAMWVQFIHKLGFRDLAVAELLKLAKANEAGIADAWEFNEWSHGETGRPMGKTYQAWSCSEFVKVCQMLKIV
ncbi:HAD-IIB family hydrolase [Pelagicoccus sp. NFK12]|uniref:HAD-IIB family hydrolase n=1 Tax=Pelagicoccus enzymogenes TaxID=2773457 RepID=A0A927F6X3_9BACT|nr:HAD-IIB family hydrolase [Pelagicoccus enzymogenes]MBD5779095.1 HAD-IIB family hydrolase [Pelagicoccus enzymogenes]MDQ8200183.1 HAD-IIB family hydrolase [Pelagicoccus enzymogenes]